MTSSKSWTSCLQSCEYVPILFVAIFTDKSSRRNTEKERQNLQSDRERRNTILRTHETELHQLQLRETDLRSQVREKETLKQGVEAMHLEMKSVTSQLKVTNTVLAPQSRD
jgi:hypothetical protein